MNFDLRLRLTPFHELTRHDAEFWGVLWSTLAAAATDDAMQMCLGPIENDEDDTGYVTYDGETFVLFLDDRMPFGMVIDYLIHELAHVHSWAHADDKEDHCDDGFGKSYAMLYRLYLDLYDNFWN